MNCRRWWQIFQPGRSGRGQARNSLLPPVEGDIGTYASRGRFVDTGLLVVWSGLVWSGKIHT
jgi:hypothetical protein